MKRMTLKEFADEYSEVLKQIEWKENLATEIRNGWETINKIKSQPEKWNKKLSLENSKKVPQLFEMLLKA